MALNFNIEFKDIAIAVLVIALCIVGYLLYDAKHGEKSEPSPAKLITRIDTFKTTDTVKTVLVRKEKEKITITKTDTIETNSPDYMCWAVFPYKTAGAQFEDTVTVSIYPSNNDCEITLHRSQSVVRTDSAFTVKEEVFTSKMRTLWDRFDYGPQVGVGYIPRYGWSSYIGFGVHINLRGAF